MSSDSNVPDSLHPQTSPSPTHFEPLIHNPQLFAHIIDQLGPNPPPLSECPFEDRLLTLPFEGNSYNHSPYHTAHTPPPFGYLETILNPSASADFLPFGYRSLSPSDDPFFPSEPEAMAPTNNHRPARLPNGYVDLTAAPDSPPGPIPSAGRKRRESPTPGPSSKRQKRDEGPATTKRGRKTPEIIEERDLSKDQTPVSELLRKQREEAVKSQTKPEEKATTFNSFTCVICMDTPTDLTATACGHLFCHTCLMEALIAGENRTGPNEPKRSQCPVCRKFINRSKATDIIPLLLKKGLATQPRKSRTPSVTAKAA